MDVFVHHVTMPPKHAFRVARLLCTPFFADRQPGTEHARVCVCVCVCVCVLVCVCVCDFFFNVAPFLAYLRSSLCREGHAEKPPSKSTKLQETNISKRNKIHGHCITRMPPSA